MSAHCGTCKYHTFKGLENYCEKWQKIIPRDKWDAKKEDGTPVCSCKSWVGWEVKTSAQTT